MKQTKLKITMWSMGILAAIAAAVISHAFYTRTSISEPIIGSIVLAFAALSGAYSWTHSQTDINYLRSQVPPMHPTGNQNAEGN